MFLHFAMDQRNFKCDGHEGVVRLVSSKASGILRVFYILAGRTHFISLFLHIYISWYIKHFIIKTKKKTEQVRPLFV
jgi:hypothetical protein